MPKRLESRQNELKHLRSSWLSNLSLELLFQLLVLALLVAECPSTACILDGLNRFRHRENKKLSKIRTSRFGSAR